MVSSQRSCSSVYDCPLKQSFVDRFSKVFMLFPNSTCERKIPARSHFKFSIARQEITMFDSTNIKIWSRRSLLSLFYAQSRPRYLLPCMPKPPLPRTHNLKLLYTHKPPLRHMLPHNLNMHHPNNTNSQQPLLLHQISRIWLASWTMLPCKSFWVR